MRVILAAWESQCWAQSQVQSSRRLLLQTSLCQHLCLSVSLPRDCCTAAACQSPAHRAQLAGCSCAPPPPAALPLPALLHNLQPVNLPHADSRMPTPACRLPHADFRMPTSQVMLWRVSTTDGEFRQQADPARLELPVAPPLPAADACAPACPSPTCPCGSTCAARPEEGFVGERYSR